MGLGGVSIWQLLIILAILVLLFGTKRLRNIGSDLGSAIKGFRSSMNDKAEEEQDAQFTEEKKPAVTAQPTSSTSAPQSTTQAQDKQG